MQTCPPKLTPLTLRNPSFGTIQAKEMQIEGNLAGDGLQNGGMLIVQKGGYKLLHFHREEVPGDHVPNGKVLQYLGLDPGEEEQQ